MIATLDDVTSKKNNWSRLLAEPGSDQRQGRALRPPSWAVVWGRCPGRARIGRPARTAARDQAGMYFSNQVTSRVR